MENQRDMKSAIGYTSGRKNQVIQQGTSVS